MNSQHPIVRRHWSDGFTLRVSLAVCCSAIAAVTACSSGKPVQGDSVSAPGAATSSRVLEHDQLDIDGDGVPDGITVVRADTASHSATRRIELKMSKAGARVLEDSAGWDPAPDEFNGNGNLLQSQVLYAADFYRAGRLLFLFGAKVGCCQQSLTIYRLGSAGPEKYWQAREIFIDRSPVPSKAKVSMFAGRALSQSAASPSSEYVSAVTYAPVVAYVLDEKPRIDSAMTRTLTRQELGGFAGFNPRTDVAALRRRDGSKVLWNFAQHRAMQ
jgi:hypothetical protein